MCNHAGFACHIHSLVHVKAIKNLCKIQPYLEPIRQSENFYVKMNVVKNFLKIVRPWDSHNL